MQANFASLLEFVMSEQSHAPDCTVESFLLSPVAHSIHESCRAAEQVAQVS